MAEKDFTIPGLEYFALLPYSHLTDEGVLEAVYHKPQVTHLELELAERLSNALEAIEALEAEQREQWQLRSRAAQKAVRQRKLAVSLAVPRGRCAA